MTIVVGLTGYAQSGKDTVGKILGVYGFQRLAFADALRNGLYALNPIIPLTPVTAERSGSGLGLVTRLQRVVDDVGWDEAKQQPEVRSLLQRYGTEAGRDIHGQDCWADIILRTLASAGGTDRYVITDVRFPNEVELVHRFGGVIWHIDRPGTGPVNDHRSDNLLLPKDLTIFNDTTLHALTSTVDKAVSELL